MPTYLDRDIAGDGSDNLAGTEVLYLVVHVTAPGDEARFPTPGVTDSVMRLGWVALGDTLDVIGGARAYWRDPVWLNWIDVLWTPVPSTADPNPLGVAASLFRWHLGIGAAAHVYVFGR